MSWKPHPRLPPALDAELRKAARIEWVTLAFLATVAAAMGLAMGDSQAMKTAWLEDLLSFAPPIVFLIATRAEKKPPNEEYPFGRLNASTVAFLSAASALLVFGGWLLIDAVVKLGRAHRPSIGLLSVGGLEAWAGWWMIAALAYSVAPPVVLGRLKLKLARKLHDKTLHTDAKMNKADWMTALATAAGVLGVGAGFWWADAVAAAAVSTSILHDGVTSLRRAVQDLMDRRATGVDGDPLPLVDRAGETLAALPWVIEAHLRTRQEGRFIMVQGSLKVQGGRGSPEDLADAVRRLRALDWKIATITLTTAPENGV